VLNVHQGVDVVNPYINYPFEPESVAPLSTIADAMHARGGRVKLYYTTRELSDHAEIIWLLKALGDEVLDGDGGVAGFRNTAEKVGGASWLQEHLHSGYSVCWSGQHKRAKFPTSKAHISAVFHSFRLILGRAIISRNGLEAWMCFRGTLTLKRR